MMSWAYLFQARQSITPYGGKGGGEICLDQISFLFLARLKWNETAQSHLPRCPPFKAVNRNAPLIKAPSRARRQ